MNVRLQGKVGRPGHYSEFVAEFDTELGSSLYNGLYTDAAGTHPIIQPMVGDETMQFLVLFRSEQTREVLVRRSIIIAACGDDRYDGVAFDGEWQSPLDVECELMSAPKAALSEAVA